MTTGPRNSFFTLVLVITSLTPIVTGWARLGQTIDETQQRYGKPIQKSKDGDTLMFKKSSYYITIHFKEGKTDALTYFKVNSKGTPVALFPKEIETLLDTNAGNDDWQPAKGSSTAWTASDRKANYNPSHFLVINAATPSKDYSHKSQPQSPDTKASDTPAQHKTKKRTQQEDTEKDSHPEKASAPKKTHSKSGSQATNSKNKHGKTSKTGKTKKSVESKKSGDKNEE
jgi:hypothetical protein